MNLLAVQGTLKSLLQHHNSKTSILRCSAFFTVQLSHPYMTTGKTIALTRWTFVGKVMSLLFNMLSRFVIGEGNGTPLQYSCLENPMDGEAWKAAVHGVAEGRTQLSNFTFMHWRRKWQPTPVFLPGESQGWQSLVGFAISGVAQGQTRLKRLSSSSSNSSSSKGLVISWLKSPSAVILKPKCPRACAPQQEKPPQ